MRRSPKQVSPRGAVPRKVKAPKVPLKERLPKIAVRVWWQALYQRRRHVYALLVMVLVIWGATSVPEWLNRYPLEVVGVEGVTDQRRQREVELRVSDLVQDKNYFNLPLSEMHERLEALGWVGSVNVRRHWPNTVKLTISEREPVAVWNDAWLVGSDGGLFEGVDKFELKALPHLYGPLERAEEVFEYYEIIQSQLKMAALIISKVEMDARLTARVTLADGVQIVVDRHQYENKLMRFVDLYLRELQQAPQQLESVDLRYADGMAVKWSQAENKRGT